MTDWQFLEEIARILGMPANLIGTGKITQMQVRLRALAEQMKPRDDEVSGGFDFEDDGPESDQTVMQNI